MRFIACGASVVGPRHIDLCESNQDAMGLTGWRGGWLASVADGLGSRTRSEIGSRRACQVVRRVLRSGPEALDLAETLKSAHQQWIKAIASVSPKDAATTLLLARVTAGGDVHAAQLGDGLLLMRCAGQFKRITPERSGYSNQTLALEAEHRADKWTMAEGKLMQPGDGVVLLTDGVADDLEPDQLSEFLDALYQDLSTRNRRGGRRWIQTELHAWATPMHSDDKTLVAVFRTSK